MSTVSGERDYRFFVVILSSGAEESVIFLSDFSLSNLI